MLTRKCDSCKNIIVEGSCTQLSKRIINTNLDNNQKAEVTLGEYCEECLKNGNAIKDLLNAAH